MDERIKENSESEKLELWMWDPVDCIHELIGNPVFDRSIAYTPEKVYVDCKGKNRCYDEMWMGDWWWKTQVS